VAGFDASKVIPSTGTTGAWTTAHLTTRISLHVRIFSLILVTPPFYSSADSEWRIVLDAISSS